MFVKIRRREDWRRRSEKPCDPCASRSEPPARPELCRTSTSGAFQNVAPPAELPQALHFPQERRRVFLNSRARLKEPVISEGRQYWAASWAQELSARPGRREASESPNRRCLAI